MKKNNSDTIDIMAEVENKTAKKTDTITHSLIAKAVAFVLAVLMAIITMASVMGALAMFATEMYTTPKEAFLKDLCGDIAFSDCMKLTSFLSSDQLNKAKEYCNDRNIAFVRFTDINTQKVEFEYRNNQKLSSNSDMNFAYDFGNYGHMIIFENEGETEVRLEITVGISPKINDNYTMAYKVVNFAYSMLYAVYIIGSIAFIMFVVCFMFLMCASGYQKGYDEVKFGIATKIPFDLFTAVAIAMLVAIVVFTIVFLNEVPNDLLLILSVCIILAIALISVVLGWSMSLATRIKLGKWWKNTIIYHLCMLVWKILKFFGRNLKMLFKVFLRFLSKIPLVWKTAFIVAGVSIVELFAILCFIYDSDYLLLVWLFSSIVIGVAVLYCAIVLKKLQKASKALADGDLSYQVDTSKMFGDFKKYGESLNSISRGMAIAVEERMKSERMKTELITNVSHDIKTPLTSIINYTDLISKEPCENEKINEYSQVLLRQSERLKRLIDDLVEASKASTGNLEVNLAPCEATILLTQLVGEYEEKLENRSLELITTKPTDSVMIRADGRRLWRVFDNLINNICKYSQSFTRVYISLEKQNDNAVITFKNTSSSPLNISADELMERFVRGDSSRNTEGNGLGLSIAKSLTELQNGTFDISIDGDLFKVILKFPIIK